MRVSRIMCLIAKSSSFARSPVVQSMYSFKTHVNPNSSREPPYPSSPDHFIHTACIDPSRCLHLDATIRARVPNSVVELAERGAKLDHAHRRDPCRAREDDHRWQPRRHGRTRQRHAHPSHVGHIHARIHAHAQSGDLHVDVYVGRSEQACRGGTPRDGRVSDAEAFESKVGRVRAYQGRKHRQREIHRHGDRVWRDRSSENGSKQLWRYRLFGHVGDRGR